MERLGLDYPTAWGRRYSTRALRHLILCELLVPYVRSISRLQVRGLEHLEGISTVILAANHTSHLDTPLVLAALPEDRRRRTVVAAAVDNFFMDAKSARRAVLMFNAIPVERLKVNRRSAQLALELVQDRWNLLIYPEGGRTPTGDLQAFKGGAAYLAERARTPVVPVYISGAGELRGPKYAKAPRFTEAPNRRRHRVVVTFGAALSVREGESIRRFNTRIEEAVVALGREVTGDPTLAITPARDPDEGS
jgi:1-acyl-sn-glycerol-3-phosphate acyltransferase